jgi:tetratricopeptide (TPR) repeat protein
MDPNFLVAHWYLGMAYEQTGRFTEAIAECKKALGLSGEPSPLGMLGHVYGASGEKAEALKVLAQVKHLSKRRYVDSFDIALICAGLGDKAQALHWLEQAYEDHSQQLLWIKVDPRLDSLRVEPRFRELLHRMHLIP